MKFADLCKLSEKECIVFLIDNALLKAPICDNGHTMNLASKGKDTYRWVCNLCKKNKALRVNNWLEGSRLEVSKILKFIHVWSSGNSTIKFCTNEINICPSAVVDWNHYLRQVCAWKVDSTLVKQKIGGPGIF